jgi:hypothetical protein
VGWWKLPPLTIDETQGGFSDKKGKQYKASQPTFVGKFSSKSADSHAWYAVSHTPLLLHLISYTNRHTAI